MTLSAFDCCVFSDISYMRKSLYVKVVVVCLKAREMHNSTPGTSWWHAEDAQGYWLNALHTTRHRKSVWHFHYAASNKNKRCYRTTASAFYVKLFMLWESGVVRMVSA